MSEEINKKNNTEENNSEMDDMSTKEPLTKGEIISSIITVALIVILFIGGSLAGCFRCTMCGAKDNRLFVFASGNDKGIEYKSCVGPAGIFGFGLNFKLWPTECLYIKKGTDTNENITGCITYYNEFGCISNTKTLSNGKYTDKVTCLGFTCSSDEYIENVNSTESQAFNGSSTCFGCLKSKNVPTISFNLNDNMPRQFKDGCWKSE